MSLRHRSTYSILLLATVALVACRASAEQGTAPSSNESPMLVTAHEEPLPADGPGATFSRSGKEEADRHTVAAGDRLALASIQDPVAQSEEEDEEAKYWDKIEFGSDQFEEVLEYINQEYIEEKIDSRRAYVSAANFVLSSLEPPGELVPVAYYKQHKDDPEQKLEGTDRDELNLQRRELFRKRYDEEQAAWKEIPFGREEFVQVMKYAEKAATKAKKKKLSSHRLWMAATQGFLYALDPHSSLVSREAWEESTKETQDASFDGIGALLTQRFEPSETLKNRLSGKTRKVVGGAPYLVVELSEEDKLRRRTFVESPMPGQPAEKAGVWAGDEIVKVDGVDVVDMSLDKVVSMIRGPKGTQVKLSVRREGTPGDLEIPVPRARIRVTNVEGRILENYPCIGYVKLTGFIETSYSDLTGEIERLQKDCAEGDGLRGLVFDLRNNSGGLLNQGVKIADLFVEKGAIVTVKNRRRAVFSFMDSQDEHYEAHKEGTLTLPMVVLVNDGSASASEIVASALQDNQRALIVGERTFGKASVQTLINPMRGQGYYIKLTVARYFAPSKRTLQVVGVNPDVEVAPSIDGKTPLGFREEDLSNHLPRIDSEYKSANEEIVKELTPCVEKRGIARRVYQDNPHPQIKFDYQLYRGADYLECLIARTSRPDPAMVRLPAEDRP
ncbi:MAG: PDZ domain-containing protein [Deltaproteobacteria bacterium]|nr:PDZ domain-containing protein [Deltaproteobacteria bacterium]